MYCLHCGNCCKTLSPFGSPCKNIIEIEGFVICGIYEKRPEECSNHKFPCDVCPIGKELLCLATLEQLKNRLISGRNICLEMGKRRKETGVFMKVVTVEGVRAVIEGMDKTVQRTINDGSGESGTFCLSDCDVSENIAQWINDEYGDADGIFEPEYTWGTESITEYIDETYPPLNFREETNKRYQWGSLCCG